MNAGNTPVGTTPRRMSAQNSGHPYATGGGGEYSAGQGDGEEGGYGTGTYQRGGAGIVPPEVSTVRATAGDVGVGGGQTGYDGEMEPPRPSLIMRILTCRCG